MLAETGPLADETEPNGFLGGLPKGPRRLHSEQTARALDVAFRGLVEAAQVQARRILETNRALLDEGATLLLAREMRADAELEGILGRVVALPGLAPRPAAVAAG